MRRTAAIALVLGLLIAGGALPIAVQASGSPLLPANDSFYRAPASLGSYAPGAIIRERPVRVSLPGRVPLADATAYQLLYRTSDGYGAHDPLGVPRIARAVADNALGHLTPQAPTMLYISTHDQLIYPAGQDRLASHYCRHGAQLDYIRDPAPYVGDDHVLAALGGFIPRALSYLDQGLSGHPLPANCRDR